MHMAIVAKASMVTAPEDVATEVVWEVVNAILVFVTVEMGVMGVLILMSTHW
jgi:hypothetical protein